MLSLDKLYIVTHQVLYAQTDYGYMHITYKLYQYISYI